MHKTIKDTSFTRQSYLPSLPYTSTALKRRHNSVEHLDFPKNQNYLYFLTFLILMSDFIKWTPIFLLLQLNIFFLVHKKRKHVGFYFWEFQNYSLQNSFMADIFRWMIISFSNCFSISSLIPVNFCTEFDDIFFGITFYNFYIKTHVDR